MMQAKGTAISSLPVFIKSKFGDIEYRAWLDSLPPKSKEIYEGHILATTWYDIRDSLSVPLKSMCDMFYHGDVKGAWESGMQSAEFGMRGVYSIMAKGSPEDNIKKTEKALALYYTPSSAKVIEAVAGKGLIRITEFPDMDPGSNLASLVTWRGRWSLMEPRMQRSE